MRDARAHYIRKNDAARIPDRYVILDTEAHRERSKNGEVQTWALAVAEFQSWPTSGRVKRQASRFETPKDLWSAVSEWTRSKRRTVLYAHNLNYDLRISQALSSLTALGWTLQDMRLDGRGSWSRWRRGQATLLLCDSASIFPVPLETLASTLGMTKPTLPHSSQREKLFKRCEADVQILSTAIIQYVTWLRSGVAGNWQMTGAAQSWSNFRHSHMTHRVLIHDDRDALAAERAAMHTGRAEAWQWGKLNRGKVWEYDWSNSYPRIARDITLPSALFGTVSAPSIGRVTALWRKYCVLAECEVTTNAPIAPVSTPERCFWPTGTFVTTLWDPEIRALLEANATIRVRRAWLYKREPVLKDWGQWILSQLGSRSENVPEWQKLILKHWSRALIGRFGMRYKAWQKYATAPTSRIYCSELCDLESGERSEIMQVGTDVFILGDLEETSDSCPQITGYIMSEARAKLWRVATRIGYNNVLYVDTDSLVVNHAGHYAIQQAADLPDFAGLRSKGEYRSVHIYGPRSAIFGGKPTVAGMPKRPERAGPHAWRGEIWRGAGESIRRGEHDSVAITARTFTLRYNTNRRAFLDGGGTAPYSLPEGNADIHAAIVPGHPRRAVLNDYPALRPLMASAKGRSRPPRKESSPVPL